MSLPRLFYELDEWMKGESLPCDALAVICLKITARLLNSDSQVQLMAKNLSLVIDTYEEHDVVEQLTQNMVLADGSLHKNLRGFSGLLKLVLTDHHVRENPAEKLRRITGVDQGIIKSFEKLCLMLEAYFELSEAFSITTKKATTAMFLESLATIYDVVYRPKVMGSNTIFWWLKERVKSDEMLKLYLSWQAIKDLKDLSKELLVLVICNKSANGEAVKVHEASNLDRCLNLAGMFGLKPLLDSGFLSLEGEPQEKTGAQNLKILKGL